MKKRMLLAATTSLLIAAPVFADTAVETGAAPMQATKSPTATEGGINFNMKGISVNLGGFIEAAGMYRSRNLNSDLPSPFQKLPLANSAGYYQDETRFSARQSRLSLLATGDVNENTHLAGYYEMDFLGAASTANSNESNSYNPRIRHLYTTVDWDRAGLHLLAGQTWSLVTMNGEGIIPRKEITPLGIDAQYVPGFTWARQPQFRIVKDWDKKYWLGLSVENGQTLVQGGQPNAVGNNLADNQAGGGALTNVTTSVNPYPDFVVKAAADPGWGHFEVYDLIRVFETSLSSNGKVNNTFRATSAVGGGMILPIIPKQLSLQVSGIYGKGIGRYGSSQLPDVTQNAAGENMPLTGSQLLAGATYDPTKEWNFYAYYGQEQVDRQSYDQNGKGYGYGSELYDNSGAGTFGGKAQGNIRKVAQETVGTWWKFYQGRMGKMQAGLQFSHTEDDYFSVVNGGAPKATDNMVFTSLRYYWQ
ncbi:hypothetical protein [Geomesophilobacter sediminis]|uniref:Uncharacterized protein n=1 Tax=Geomesophilobacter sediminis TaxID=2798584 RepID=A0A8J7JM09_9BACT|nr:hypothetical protein [Geomesophilobacter sediminis]MBJ6725550.1 hypothetical protein [Geomesophilobacter sediminis]